LMWIKSCNDAISRRHTERTNSVSIGEHGAVARQFIYVWSFNLATSVTPQSITSEMVSCDKYNVGPLMQFENLLIVYTKKAGKR